MYTVHAGLHGDQGGETWREVSRHRVFRCAADEALTYIRRCRRAKAGYMRTVEVRQDGEPVAQVLGEGVWALDCETLLHGQGFDENGNLCSIVAAEW